MLIRHNRIEGDAISVIKGSNIAYASSIKDLNSIKDGSYLRIAGENNFYIVQKTEDYVFLADFEVLNQTTIVCEGQVTPKLQPGDNIKVVFKEYELDIVSAIVNFGSSYKYKDILSIDGGVPSLNLKDGRYQKTEIVINGVDDTGKITRIGVNFRGRYLEAPKGVCSTSGGNGKNAQFELVYKTIDNATVIERKIKDIDYIEGKSRIYLWDQIPVNVTGGTISCNKWQLILHTNYINNDRLGIPYSLTCDFTPTLQLPLMAPNSFSIDIVYNQAISQLETEVVKLREEIKELKSQLQIKVAP